MLRDDFEKLMAQFAMSAEGKISLEDIFSQSLEFFEKLKYRVKTGTPEEKAEALQLIHEMHNRMLSELKKIADKSGLTEEQLMALAENPSNFSQEQWKSIQEARQKMAQAGQELFKISGLAEEPKKPKKRPPGKSGKSGWIRS